MPDLSAEFDRLPWCPGYPAPGSPWCKRPQIHRGHRWVGAPWSEGISSTVAGPLPDIEDWDHGDVVITLKRQPWWRRIWRRRG